MASSTTTPSPVTVSLADLEAGNIPFSTLESAFGPTSLGILLVSDLPTRFQPLRHKLLTYASHLAQLPASTLSSLTSAEARYLVGWSHGRELLPPKQAPDTHKGSFYVNCAFYQDPELQAAPATPAFPHFPEYTSPNVWPAEDVIPGFQAAFRELCCLVIDVAALVARSIDRYARERIDEYPVLPPAEGETKQNIGYLESVVRGSYTTKARLLHYFPPEDTQVAGDGEDDAWCATHLDHGCLTGLTSALYLPADGLPPLPALPTGIPCPDNTAGLYIWSRSSEVGGEIKDKAAEEITEATSKAPGEPNDKLSPSPSNQKGTAVRVSIPADNLAFQTGEALQKITQGRFRAVPHYVSPGRDAAAMRGVVRNTLAVFTQPNLDDLVDRVTGECFGGFAGGVVKRNTVAS